MNKTIPINEATDKQLRDFAIQSQQLELHHSTGRAKILAALAPVWDKDYIVVSDDEPAPDAPAALVQTAQPVSGPVRSLQGGDARSDPKVEITLGHGSLAGGDAEAFVGVNGRPYRIQRGMRMEVPYRVYLALINAQRGEARPGPMDSEGSTPPVITEVTNYPLTVHRLPSQEEIDAFHAATREVEIA